MLVRVVILAVVAFGAVGGGEPRMIDCAMLRFVRRSEVRKYLAEQRKPGVQCEDGTPLSALGVPSS